MSAPDRAITRMTGAIVSILASSEPTVYLYGSAATGDYRRGWSDIDLLCLTRQEIRTAQADALLMLRQRLQEQGYEEARSFEGSFLPAEAFFSGTPARTVYWGTSGQRITDGCSLDSFSRLVLLDCGAVLHGPDERSRIDRPSREMLLTDVARHLHSIRVHGSRTGRSLYSFGWLLDIARGLYTIQTGGVAAKTAAGEWALAQHLCPEPAVMELALRVRRNPLAALADDAVMNAAAQLGPAIQAFADMLEAALIDCGVYLPCK